MINYFTTLWLFLIVLYSLSLPFTAFPQATITPKDYRELYSNECFTTNDSIIIVEFTRTDYLKPEDVKLKCKSFKLSKGVYRFILLDGSICTAPLNNTYGIIYKIIVDKH